MVDPNINPGDQAAPGSPDSGENVCPACGGTGELNGDDCSNCGGTGRVIETVGGE
jgi:DnaJ-class molecular chaperone